MRRWTEQRLHDLSLHGTIAPYGTLERDGLAISVEDERGGKRVRFFAWGWEAGDGAGPTYRIALTRARAALRRFRAQRRTV